MQKRQRWPDIVKGIGIFAVIVSHTGFLPFSRITSPFISSWMLPLFAFIGGYLFTHKDLFPRYVEKKFRKLIVPYVVVGLISFAGWLYLRNVYPQNLLFGPVTNQVYKFLLGKTLVFNGPLWFLPAYFLTCIIAYSLYPYWNSKRTFLKLTIVVLFAVTSSVLISLKTPLPYSIDIVLLFVVFFLAGILYKKRGLHLERWLLGIIVIVFISSSLLNGTVDLYQRNLNHTFLFWLSSFTGVLLITELSKKFQTLVLLHPFRYMGAHSLTLLITHWPAIQWLSYFLFLSGIPQLVGANPTLTSFWLPHTGETRIRILVFIYLLFYLFSILLIGQCINSFLKRKR